MTDCYLNTITITVGGSYADFYVGFYGDSCTITFKTKVGTGPEVTQSFNMSSVTVDYKNIFLVTLYKFALYTGGSWSTFEAEVNTNGKGYDQVYNQWYSYGNPILKITSSGILTATQTTPIAGRTIAVDSPL